MMNKPMIRRPSRRYAYDPEAQSRALLFEELDDEYRVVSVAVLSKRRPIVLYQVPAQDSDLWGCGRIIHDE